MHPNSPRSTVSVYARVRPAPVIGRRRESLVTCEGDFLIYPTALRDECRTRSHVRFDRAFGPENTNAEVSSQLLSRMDLQGAVKGVGPKILFMAYGHTGSGKTHSLFGGDDFTEDGGLVGAFLEIIMDECEHGELSVSIVEVYKEKIYDLLSPSCSALPLRCGSVVDAIKAPLNNIQEALRTINSGLANRTVDRNASNHRSSRSHTLVMLHVCGVQRITVVDLAGSERWCRFGPLSHDKRPDSREEMASINKSLTSLSLCVMNMTQPTAARPTFRATTLTRLLSTFFVEPPSCVHVLVCVAADVVGKSSSMARQTLLTDTQRSVQFAATMKKTFSFIRNTENHRKRGGSDHQKRSASLPPCTSRGSPPTSVSRGEHEDLKNAVASLKSELDREREMRLKLETMMKVHWNASSDMPTFPRSSSPPSLHSVSSRTTVSEKISAVVSSPLSGSAGPVSGDSRDRPIKACQWTTPLPSRRRHDSLRSSSNLRRRSKPLSECTSSAPLSAGSLSPLTICSLDTRSVGYQSLSQGSSGGRTWSWSSTAPARKGSSINVIGQRQPRRLGLPPQSGNKIGQSRAEGISAAKDRTKSGLPSSKDLSMVRDAPSSSSAIVEVTSRQHSSPIHDDSRSKRWDEILERCWRAPRRLTPTKASRELGG